MKTIVDESIEELAREFKATPSLFFSESDFQYRLYSILKSKNELNRTVASRDGKSIHLVHPEYPSVKRVKLSTGKGYRVWFDLAILNPDFIQNNTYKTVSARDEKDAKAWGKNVLIAIELKFFPKKLANMSKIVEQDCFKLSKCEEVGKKYVVVFSMFTPSTSFIKKIKKHTVKLIWIGAI